MDVTPGTVGVVVERPWGAFQVIATGVGHQVKRLTLEPGGVLSLQRHARRSEHWVVLSGRGAVTLGERRFEVGPDDSVRVAAGVVHRLEAMGPERLVVIEVQVGPYLGEDDIERFEDRYGRG